MSGLGFAERVKLLLQKRLDSTKWPIGDQPPGGLRYLSDGQGNLMAIVTTSVNPNDASPVGPGSQESAAETDPILTLHEEIQLPYTAVKFTGVAPFSATAPVEGTNTIMTFEHPAGTDFSIGATKTGMITRVLYYGSVAGTWVKIGYGDDGVAEGTTDPTTPVWLLGENAAGESPLVVTTADVPYVSKVALEIPAGKFPFVELPATNAIKPVHIFGYTRDT